MDGIPSFAIQFSIVEAKQNENCRGIFETALQKLEPQNDPIGYLANSVEKR